MERFEWLKGYSDEQIRQKASVKIENLRAIEDELPLILIIHDIASGRVEYMSKSGLNFLGITLEEIRMGINEYHDRYFNPDDVDIYLPKVMGLIQRNIPDETVSFFQQVRGSASHDWTWHLSSSRVFLHDESGKPLLLLTQAVPIEQASKVVPKVDRIMEENNFSMAHNKFFELLTRREKQVLALMARGSNASQIASVLHISEATASTHRRNIRKKLNADSTYDLTRFAQAFDLI